MWYTVYRLDWSDSMLLFISFFDFVQKKNHGPGILKDNTPTVDIPIILEWKGTKMKLNMITP